MKACLVIFLTLSFSFFQLQSQNTQSEAINLYEQGNYNESLAMFKSLLEHDKQNPLLNYYAGLCVYKLGTDWNRSLEYFKAGDVSTEYPEYLFYLGKTYLNLFDTDKALSCFNEFEKKSGFKFLKPEFRVTEYIESAKVMKDLLNKPFNINIINVDTVFETNIYKYYNISPSAKGKWINKEQHFFQESGLQSSYGMIYENNDNLIRDECLYFSAKPIGFKSDDDIYSFCQSGETFGPSIQRLPTAINGNGNEQIPVYDNREKVLYFSSKEHPGMGGYDIFMSKYNTVLEKWETPINLGFPINSPFDDYFVGLGDHNTWFIATNRYSTPNRFLIVQIKKPDENNLQKGEYTPSEFLEIAKFQKVKTNSNEKKIVPDIQQTQGNSFLEATKQLTINQDDNYNKTLKKALDYQLKADSVMRLADELRFTLSSLDNAKRIECIKKIQKFEQESSEYQKIADISFAEARKIELSAEKDNSENHLFKEKKKQNSIIENKKDTDFQIFSVCRYSPQFPIPMDEPLPDGLIYKIQLGVYSKEITYDFFGGIYPISGQNLVDRGLKKFYAGEFLFHSDAEGALAKVHEQGFVDAFIVAWFNGNKISLARADDVEKTLYHK